jgi:hypothetical protein
MLSPSLNSTTLLPRMSTPRGASSVRLSLRAVGGGGQQQQQQQQRRRRRRSSSSNPLGCQASVFVRVRGGGCSSSSTTLLPRMSTPSGASSVRLSLRAVCGVGGVRLWGRGGGGAAAAVCQVPFKLCMPVVAMVVVERSTKHSLPLSNWMLHRTSPVGEPTRGSLGKATPHRNKMTNRTNRPVL